MGGDQEKRFIDKLFWEVSEELGINKVNNPYMKFKRDELEMIKARYVYSLDCLIDSQPDNPSALVFTKYYTMLCFCLGLILEAEERLGYEKGFSFSD